ncbi:type-F conjugative transfer system secretin TraK [Photobacterium damselae]|uniref:type-F conjugative transfer system secretin TraK n=1 Tax=Photobacterium damselae TaxID=38293 RepID=UPI004068109D
MSPSRLLLGVLAFASTSVLATPPTTLSFNDNETVPLTLSSLDINRLVVKHDRITSVTCPTGFCTLPMNGAGDDTAAPSDPQGASLIGINVQEPFTLYVTTEKGHSFGAFVRPMAVPAVTTVFVSMERDTRKASAFEKRSPYTQMLATLVKHMIRETTPEGYTVTPIAATSSSHAINQAGLTITPKTQYQGEHFTGVVYTVTNKTGQARSLVSTSFYRPGVKAVSFSSYTLLPHSSVLMYQVTGQ